MNIIEEVNDNKFNVKVNPSSTKLSLEVNGVSRSASFCTDLQSKSLLIYRRDLDDNWGFSGWQ